MQQSLIEKNPCRLGRRHRNCQLFVYGIVYGTTRGRAVSITQVDGFGELRQLPQIGRDGIVAGVAEVPEDVEPERPAVFALHDQLNRYFMGKLMAIESMRTPATIFINNIGAFDGSDPSEAPCFCPLGLPSPLFVPPAAG